MFYLGHERGTSFQTKQPIAITVCRLRNGDVESRDGGNYPSGPRESENTKPLEEVTPVSIHPDLPDCHVMIGTELTEELRVALVKFLKENYNVFA